MSDVREVALPPRESSQQTMATQLKKIIAGRKFHCGHCANRIPVTFAYRCLYCGVWFCQSCAELHFGETRSGYHAESC